VTDTSGITKVEWLVDGKPIGESTQAPFTFEWDKPQRGNRTLTVTAVDAAGNRAVSTPRIFVVE
jgi:hypothetical protein